MNIPETVIEPFGYTGMPTISIPYETIWDNITRALDSYKIFNATMDPNIHVWVVLGGHGGRNRRWIVEIPNDYEGSNARPERIRRKLKV